jgi:hypothetical protein
MSGDAVVNVAGDPVSTSSLLGIPAPFAIAHSSCRQFGSRIPGSAEAKSECRSRNEGTSLETHVETLAFSPGAAVPIGVGAES